MEKSFVIECDSERSTVFVYEVDKAHERSEVIYKRPLGEPQIFNEFIGPKMYGKLQAILFSADYSPGRANRTAITKFRSQKGGFQ